MSEISLRAYLRHIDELIDQGHLDEAVAHCRHILQQFPKAVEVYRLLGKAYLEAKRLDEARDIFQRVLAANPDDYLAHAALSLISEENGDLDAALWHMERAFEANPSNVALQDELRRLYQARHRSTLPRVRLTRGALARMYYHGGLYTQAIAELRAALSEDPDRVDLLLLLAKAYHAEGQEAQAVQVCAQVLKKLPYCREANRLMAEILALSDRKEEAEVYLRRWWALEPYAAFVSEQAPTPDQVPDEQITLDMLEWTPEMAAEHPSLEGSTWADSLGIDLPTEPEPEEEGLPEWAVDSVLADLPTPGEAAGLDLAGETPGLEETPTPAGPAEPEETIPDWMRELGWEPREGPAEEEPMPFVTEEPPPAEPVAPDELPDWLKEMAPEEVLEEGELGADLAAEPLPWLEEEEPGASDTVVTWLQEHAVEGEPLASQAPTASEEPLPDWLRDLAAEEEGGVVEEPPVAEEPLPDWLSDLAEEEAPAAAAMPEAAVPGVEEEAPDWLSELAEEEVPGVEAAAPAEAEAPATEEMPDWLSELAEEEAPAVEAAVSAEAVPEAEVPPVPEGEDEALAWLEQLAARQGAPVEELITGGRGPGEMAAPPAAEAEAAAEEEPLPDWLSDLAEEEAPAAAAMPEAAVPGVAEEAPDWLSELAEEEVPGVEAAAPAEAEAPATEEMPDWLSELAEEEAPAAEAADSAEAVPEAEVPPVPEGEDEALAWLEQLAARQGAPAEELITGGRGPGEMAAPPAAEAEAAAEEEAVLDWLSELAEEASAAEAAPEAGEPAQAVAEEAAQAQIWEGAPVTGEDVEAEVPEWLREAEEGLEEAAAAPVEEAAAEEAMPAWLREATVTAEEDVGWLTEEAREALRRELEAEEGAPAEAAPAAEVTLSAAEADEVPEWLREAEEGLEEAAAAPVEEAAAEEAMPAWLQEVEAEATTAAEEDVGWLTEEAREALRCELEAEEGGPAEVAPSTVEEAGEPGWVPELEGGPEEVAAAEAPTPEEAGAAWVLEESLPQAEGALTRPAPADRWAALLQSGREALEKGDLPGVLDAYRRLVRKGKHLDQVIEDLQEALYRFPVEVDLWQLLGDAYMRADRLQEALAAYTKAEELLR